MFDRFRLVANTVKSTLGLGRGEQITGTDIVGDKRALDVAIQNSISGEVTPSGLRISMRVTTLLVGTTATPLPATPLSGRNSMKVTNHSASQILYLSGDPLMTADRVVGTTSGDELPPGESFAIDIKDTIILYGRYAAIETQPTKVMELA